MTSRMKRLEKAKDIIPRTNKKKNKKSKKNGSKSVIEETTSRRNKRHRRIHNKDEEDSNNNDDGDETLWDVFIHHPLIRVGMFIVIPYALSALRILVQLQYPEYVPGVSLRPAVTLHDPRQVLIVGTPSSGTVQMTKTFTSLFQLEIGHEVSDASWHFVRDGTISWFHGIRFLPHPNSVTEKANSFVRICGDTTSNMGFHPAAYRPPEGNCSYRLPSWNKNANDQCWKKECYTILSKEWSCASHTTKEDENDHEFGSSSDCETKFVRNLHQVRNPLRTIESLVVKFCIGGVDTNTVSDSFLTYATALFPHHDFTQDSCIEAVGYFVVYYQTAMIDARLKDKTIHDYYRIEDSTPCEVAQRAGFMDDGVLYPPNRARLSNLCSNPTFEGNQLLKQEENKVNTKQVQLGWKDLRGGQHGSHKTMGNRDLEKKILLLFHAFGYDTTQESEEGAPKEEV